MSADERRVSKVVMAGPVGVGKTTAVQAASDVPVLTTEARPSDETRLSKETTTVALDFGVLRLDGSVTVHLYGTPGQRRFDFMWDILTSNSSGVVLLVDASDPDPEEGFDPYLEAFAPMLAEGRLALGITRLPAGSSHALGYYRERLGEAGAWAPVLEADPRSRLDVLVLIRALLATAERGAVR